MRLKKFLLRYYPPGMYDLMAIQQFNDLWEKSCIRCPRLLFYKLKVIPLKLFYYQTFFETWLDYHS